MQNTIKKSSDIGFIRTMSNIVTRLNLGRHLYARNSGTRDYYKVFGYKDILTYEDLLAKYVRQGISTRIVDAPAQALWNDPPIIESNNEEWNKIWNDLLVQHNLWEIMLRLDKLCGLGRYACLFIGVNNSGKLDKAVPNKISNNTLRKALYFQVYSQNTAEIDTLFNDSSEANYLKPASYTIYPFKNDNASDIKIPTISQSSFKVHSDRVLHVAEGTLENDLFGFPRLEKVFNDLDDMLKVSGGTAETYWLTSNRGMQVDVDKEMDLSPEDAQNLTDELDEYQNQLRRYIRTRGIKINNLGSDIPEPKQTFEMLISLISGSTGIPRRLLIGSEAGQLASEQDRANWAERKDGRRKEFGEPRIIFPFIKKLTQLQVLPSPDNLRITITWPDAFKLSPLELAQKSAQHARSATNFARTFETMAKLKTEGQMKDGDELVTISEAREMMELDIKPPQIDDPKDLNT